MRTKKRLTLGTAAVVFIAFMAVSLVGCNEMKRLADRIYDFHPPYKAIGTYHEGNCIMFLMNMETGLSYLDLWNVQSGKDETWFVKRNGECSYRESIFYPTGWTETNGIMGHTVFIDQNEITKREFLKAIKPHARILIKQGIELPDCMRPIAVELGYIQKIQEDSA